MADISWNAQMTELELNTFFSQFGTVKDSKIITDRNGVSKGWDGNAVHVHARQHLVVTTREWYTITFVYGHQAPMHAYFTKIVIISV